MADGKQLTLRVGATPVDLGGASSSGNGRRVVLSADTRGHFVTNGSINDRAVQFMVDTGATTLAIGQAEAERIGLDYKGGQPVGMHTANGVVRGWLIRAGKVRVGDVTVHDVETVRFQRFDGMIRSLIKGVGRRRGSVRAPRRWSGAARERASTGRTAP